MRRLPLTAILLLTLASVADAQTSAVGVASCTAGDTIEIRGQRSDRFIIPHGGH